MNAKLFSMVNNLILNATNIPRIGLGTYKLTGQDCIKAVTAALGAGYRHIDTAQMYGNEAEIGRAMTESKVPRQEIFITTKIWPSNFHRLTEAVKESLQNLKLEKLDLLLLHWPGEVDATHAALHMLNEVLHKQYASHVGVSNFNIELLKKAVAAAPIVCNQVEYHPLLNQQTLLQFMNEQQLFATAYSPLAQGRAVNNALVLALAEKYNKTAAQICLRWLIQQPNVAAIPKAATLERQINNLDVLNFSMTEADMQALFAIGTNTHFVNASTAPVWDF